MSETVISKDTKFKGSINSAENLIIFGATEGLLEVNESVTIQPGASVTGDIIAKVLIVRGTFTGNADCDTIYIQKGGLLNGVITSRILAVESKGYFEGKNTPKKRENLPANQDRKILKEPSTENILL